MVMKEKDDDLDLFLEMQSRETERNSLLLQCSDDFDEQIRTVLSEIQLILEIELLHDVWVVYYLNG